MSVFYNESLQHHFKIELEPKLRNGDIALIRSDYILSLNPDSNDNRYVVFSASEFNTQRSIYII